jgi:carboxyl-terminal processing protease
MNTNRIKGLLLLSGGAVLGFGLAVGGAVVAGLAFPPDPAASAALGEQRLLGEVMDRIRTEYVDPVPDDTLVASAARGMVTGLDPHSRLLDAAEYEQVRISTSGHYTGVGLEVRSDGDRVVVVGPIPGSAAERAGLRAGDVLVSVDGQPVTAASLDATIRRLRGAPGTPVQVTARRAEALLPFRLLRGPVQVQSVRATALGDGLGYVRITQFSDRTATDLARAVRDLRAADGGLRGLVLDLRDNPGGVLDAAVAVADMFLERGVIVSASGRTRDARFRREATAGDLLAGAPLAVLVNGNSASAAEIVAGALHDHGRATLLGARTFGKGSVQTVLPLSDGRALKLTTSRYYTPAGDSIQSRGIEPDVALAALADGPWFPAGDPQVTAARDVLTGATPAAPSRRTPVEVAGGS